MTWTIESMHEGTGLDRRRFFKKFPTNYDIELFLKLNGVVEGECGKLIESLLDRFIAQTKTVTFYIAVKME